MSGNSSFRRRQTAPIVSGRPARSETWWPWPPLALEERQLVLPDLHLVTVFEQLRVDPAAVDERSVQRALSLIAKPLPCRSRRACRRDTVTSSRKMSASGERPIVSRSRSSTYVSPERPASERTMSAVPRPRDRAPASRSSSSAGSSEDSVWSPALVGDERRAALLAETRGLEVLEAALGAVDVRQPASSPSASSSSWLIRGRGLDGQDLGQLAEIDLPERALPSPPARAGARRAPHGGCRSCRGGSCGDTRCPALRRGASGSGRAARRPRGSRDREVRPQDSSFRSTSRYALPQVKHEAGILQPPLEGFNSRAADSSWAEDLLHRCLAARPRASSGLLGGVPSA